MATVSDNMIGFNNEQIEAAKKAKQLYHKIRAPGVGNFKYIIKGNMIKDCLVRTEDINNMIKIWGKDIAYIKGKQFKEHQGRL